MKLQESIKLAIENGYTVEGKPMNGDSFYKIILNESGKPEYEDKESFEDSRILLSDELRVFVPISLNQFVSNFK